ncbi:hypothetical protein [Fusobacterium russii]|uniref:hypothetical protein n=1 Tax=Fusobacterium russii TaxID=854 RepID=UPI00039FF3B2|nr:hypothetical protein [Fusobacterium russii]
MKKLIFYILFIIIGKFAFAVVNTHQPGSAAWHNYNNMLWGQLEYDRQLREQQAAQQSQLPPQQPMEVHISWSVFAWNDETGNTFYLPCGGEIEGRGAKKSVVNRAKKFYFQVHGEKSNRHFEWDCSFAVITMGVGKKSGKIEAFVESDLKKWIKKYGADDPDFKAKVERDALQDCEKEAYNCEIMYELGDFGEK